MTEVNVENAYYEWLLSIVGVPPITDYYLLLQDLFRIDFTWSVRNDDNRAADGLELRRTFFEEGDYSDGEYPFADLTKDCSVLEMLVALSKRCEDDIMHNPNYGDQTHIWFWIMIGNLKLDRYDDEHYDRQAVYSIVSNLVNRTYKRNGDGSLFPGACGKKDARKVEIWYQMSWYFNDHYDQLKEGAKHYDACS